MWGRKESALKRGAAELSQHILALDELGQERAIQTIHAIKEGITNLGSLPQPIIDSLWSLLMVIARKAIVSGGGSGMFDEILDGLDPRVRDMIEREARK